MGKKQLTRREFLRLTMIGASATTFASCAPRPIFTQAPIVTQSPSAAVTTPLLEISYPRKDTRVTNPKVIFKWKPVENVSGYVLEVFILSPDDDGKFSWKLAFSVFTSDNFFDPNGNGHSLSPGGLYYWIATAIKEKISLPPSKDYVLASGLSLDINQKIVDTIPLPTRDQFPGTISVDDGKFYLKPEMNYLNEYLKIKKANLEQNKELSVKPIIPLIFYLMDRYVRINDEPGILQSTPLDNRFAEAMKIFNNEPKPPLDINISEKIRKAVGYYKQADDDLKNSLFGVDFKNFPADDNAENWIGTIIDTMFTGSWLEQLHKEISDKTIEIQIGKPLILYGKNSVKGPIHLEILGPINFKSITGNETCTLKIKAKNGESISIDDLQLVKDNEGKQYLHSESSAFSNLDSASFTATLILLNNPEETIDGFATIMGGKPVIQSVDPITVAELSPDVIKVKVRDGGQGKSVVLTDSNNDKFTIDITNQLIEQTLFDQTYIFVLAEPTPFIASGAYKLSYENYSNISSVNNIEFQVTGLEYKVSITQIYCKDESNPEWWGDDSISFSTLNNTRNFLHVPTSSHVKGGFHDNISKQFSEDDNLIYGPRIIEGYLTISIAIYEHDDLEWLAWIINKAIDVVQSILEGIVDAYTGGAGGYVIEAGLEVSGVNDMREAAINSMVSGWEVELLSENETSLDNPKGQVISPQVLYLKGSDSEYQVTYNLSRA